MTQPTPTRSCRPRSAPACSLIGLALAAGAVGIPSAAGYGGVGPNFLPWLVAVRAGRLRR